MQNLGDIQAKCINNHEAIRICIDQSCQNIGLMCSQNFQQCQSKHQNCHINFPIQTVLKKIQDQGYLEIEQYFVNYYDKIQKMVTIKKQQYISHILTPQQKLTGNQQLLYNSLKYGMNKQIIPQFVSRTLKESTKLKQQNLLTFKKNSSQVQKIFKQIQRLLNRIGQLSIVSKQNINKQYDKLNKSQKGNKNIIEHYFAKDAVHENYKIINDKTIKVIKSDPSSYRFALISPPFDQIQQMIQTITLRIINSANKLWLGAAHSQTIIQNNFSANADKIRESGIYLIRGSGLIYNSIQRQSSFYTDFNFSDKDIISMQYNNKKMKLKITNVTKNISQEMKFEYKKQNAIHFCIWADVPNTQIHIIPNNTLK